MAEEGNQTRRGGAAPVAAWVVAALAESFGLLDAPPARASQRVPELAWGRLDAAGLRAAATETGRAIAALEHQQRLVLAEIDRRKAYTVDGARDAADWAANHLGVSRKKANDQVRLAQQLVDKPRLSDAAANGELTSEQAAPAAQLATADGTDAAWGTQAPKLPVGVLNRHAAKRARPTVRDRAQAHAARTLTTWTNGGQLLFRGAVPTDEGARLLTALERSMPAKDPEAPATLDQRRADALMALAGATLAADDDPDRATVALVAELAAITDEDPAATAELESGQPLATETARRLICDGRTQLLVQDADGVIVAVGATARVVTPATRRALMRRDGHCRFPGCSATSMLQAHHVVPWPSPTTMDNLAMLCWHHHHLVHEGGWTLAGDPNHELRATNPTHTHTSTSWPQDRLPDGTRPPAPPRSPKPAGSPPSTEGPPDTNTAAGSRSGTGPPGANEDHPGLFDDPG